VWTTMTEFVLLSQQNVVSTSIANVGDAASRPV